MPSGSVELLKIITTRYKNGGISLSDYERMRSFLRDTNCSQNPNDPLIWKTMGNSFFKEKDYYNALKCYENAVEINHCYADALNNIAMVYKKIGRNEDAEKLLNFLKTLEQKESEDVVKNNIPPSSPPQHFSQYPTVQKIPQSYKPNQLPLITNGPTAVFYYNQGLDFVSREQFQEAITSFDKALQINPDYANAWYNRGTSLIELGLFDEAITAFDKALNVNPDDSDAWHNRGKALDELGQHDEAIKSFDRALKNKPNDSDTWNYRGIAFAKLGRYDEAISSFNNALKIDPKNKLTQHNLDITLKKNQNSSFKF